MIFKKRAGSRQAPLDKIAPEELKDTPSVPFWATLFSFTRTYHGKLIIAAVCALLVGPAVALQPLCFKFIIDHGIMRKTGAVLAPGHERVLWALVFGGVYIALSFYRIMIWLFGHLRMIEAIEGVVCRLRNKFFRHVQSLCFRFHDQVSSGELFNYIMGSPLNSIKQFLSQFAMATPGAIVMFFVAMGLMLYLNWILALITLAISAIMVGINFRSRKVIHSFSADFMKTESLASKYVADMLRGARAVKIYAMEQNVSGSFAYQITHMRDKGIALGRRQKFESVKPELLNYIGMVIIYMIGGYMCIYRGMSIGTLVTFGLYYTQIMGPIMLFLSLNLVRSNAEAGLDRIMRTSPSHPRRRAPSAVRPALCVEKNSPVWKCATYIFNTIKPGPYSEACHVKSKMGKVWPS